jgi:hypothetical protein
MVKFYDFIASTTYQIEMSVGLGFSLGSHLREGLQRIRHAWMCRSMKHSPVLYLWPLS